MEVAKLTSSLCLGKQNLQVVGEGEGGGERRAECGWFLRGWGRRPLCPMSLLQPAAETQELLLAQ